MPGVRIARNQRIKKHFDFDDMKRAKHEAKHSRNRSTDAPRIPFSNNNARHVLADYVPSLECFYGATYKGNRRPLVYKSQVKAQVKFRCVLEKRKKEPRVQETPVLYDRALWFSLYGDEPLSDEAGIQVAKRDGVGA